MVTHTSLSAKRFTWALVSGRSRCSATAWASTLFELPASSFMWSPRAFADSRALSRGLVAGERRPQASGEADRRQQPPIVGLAALEGSTVGEELVGFGAGVAPDPGAGPDACAPQAVQDEAGQVEH